ncbi:MAG: redoxin domain-containing protein [Dehalococcoidia bacterium]|nr:redoxin domain-containing protein [Dehalococcoidia bacterium]
MKVKDSRQRKADLPPEWQDDDSNPGGRLRFLLVPAIVLALVGAVVWIAQASQGDGVGQSTRVDFGGKVGGAAPIVGQAAPDFTLTNLEGKSVSLSSFRGKAVMVNFFATWCPPCRAEMPTLQSTYKDMQSQGFEIVAVDLQEDQGAVSGYAKSLGLSFTILLDRNATVYGQYHITGLPTSYFIDRDGIVKDYVIGGLSKDLLKQKLNNIL